MESELLKIIKENNRSAFAGGLIGKFDNPRKFLLGHVLVDHRKRDFRRNYLIEDNPAGSCIALPFVRISLDRSAFRILYVCQAVNLYLCVLA